MLSRQSLLRAARTAVPRQSAVLSQTRAFASPASGSDQVKPPVAVYGLDGTYATALVRSLSSVYWTSIPSPLLPRAVPVAQLPIHILLLQIPRSPFPQN